MANKRRLKKKATPLQQQYQKERKRLQQAARRAQQRGYEFPTNPVPELPKRVTKKALERIKATKPNDLYKKAIWTDTSTGEILKGETARQLEKQAVAYKSAQTRKQNKAERQAIDQKLFAPPVPKQPKQPEQPKQQQTKIPANLPSFTTIVVSNFRAELTNFPQEVQNIFFNWIDNLSSKIGIDGVAEVLQEAKAEGLIQYSQFASSGEGAQATIQGLTQIANQLFPLDTQTIADELEFDEDWELPQ